VPGFSVEVKGLAELKAKLDALAHKKQKTIMNRALKAGAQVYQAEIEQRTPERHESPSGTALPPGALKHDIEIHTLKDPSDPNNTLVTVGPGKHTEHVMRWLEFGHQLVRNTNLAVGTVGKGRGRLGKGGTVVTNVPAYPIMRPSYETASSAAQDAVVQSLRADLANVNAIQEGE
jgi:HK97 gp10 family phage protein